MVYGLIMLRRSFGAIAGIHISENLKNLFEKRGFFVIEHKKGFKSKDYSV